MHKIIHILLLVFLLVGMFSHARAEDEQWSYIPRGGKPSYMGIHGGTMPVSLLASEDGSSLFTFVGQTGNDFMEVLKKVHIPMPSFANATKKGSPYTMHDTGLVAGNSTATMPVFSLSGDILTALDFEYLQPFGLSAQPLSIEGAVEKPEHFPRARSFRRFFLPGYFQPRIIR